MPFTTENTRPKNSHFLFWEKKVFGLKRCQNMSSNFQFWSMLVHSHLKNHPPPIRVSYLILPRFNLKNNGRFNYFLTFWNMLTGFDVKRCYLNEWIIMSCIGLPTVHHNTNQIKVSANRFREGLKRESRTKLGLNRKRSTNAPRGKLFPRD